MVRRSIPAPGEFAARSRHTAADEPHDAGFCFSEIGPRDVLDPIAAGAMSSLTVKEKAR